MFSQSWDSPSPDLQVTPSPPSPSKKNRSPMLGLRWANIFDSHGMEMEKWKIYRKTSPENGRFNRIWAVNMRSVCHPKTIKNNYLRKTMWCSTRLVFFGRNYMLPGWAFRKEDPRLRWCSAKTIRLRLRLRRQKPRFFGNTWHYETNLVAVAESDDLSIFWVCLKIGYIPKQIAI